MSIHCHYELIDREAALRRRKRQKLANTASKVFLNTMFGLMVIISLYISYHLWQMG
ncbi:MAG: hypothetical protein ACR2RF_09625 [Geminicoccaceae bacterium]